MVNGTSYLTEHIEHDPPSVRETLDALEAAIAEIPALKAALKAQLFRIDNILHQLAALTQAQTCTCGHFYSSHAGRCEGTKLDGGGWAMDCDCSRFEAAS